MSYIIYILVHNISNKTYVGITNNPIRRLRQHNCEIKGGAKYTTNNKNEGVWSYYGTLSCNENMDKKIALSIEKKIKIYSRKQKGTPIEKRMKAINIILCNYDNIIFTQKL